MGERSPHNNPNARGTFIGMTMDTTRADMTQAVLEGVAFALRDSFEVARSLGIHIERTKICGGGAKSPLWKKIMANVLGIKVDMIESEEGPGYGGAILAAVDAGNSQAWRKRRTSWLRLWERWNPIRSSPLNTKRDTSSSGRFILHARSFLIKSFKEYR